MFVGKFFADRPTLRGFLIIVAIVLAIMLLNLYTAAVAIGMLLRIASFLGVAFFISWLGREGREEFSTWSTRELVVFYGSALLIVAALGLSFWHGWRGYEQLGFIGVVGCSGFAMWGVWRDRRH